MEENDKINELFSITDNLIKDQKYADALNNLIKIFEIDKNNTKAKMIREQLVSILNYQKFDIFASTNLNVDPWFE